MIDFSKKLFKWGPIDGSILLMSYPTFSMFREEKKRYGYGWPEGYLVFQDEKVTWVNDMEKLLRVSKNFTKKYILNRGEKDIFLEALFRDEKRLFQMFDSLSGFSFGVSFEKLVQDFLNLSKAYYEFWISWGTMEFINFGLEEILRQKLASLIFPEESFQEAFALLSTPVDFTFYRQEEKELIEILFLPKEKWDEALKEHAKKYFWILNSYLSSQVLTKAFFQKELDKLQNVDYKKFYEEIKKYKEKISREKNLWLKEHYASTSFLNLIHLLETFIIIQDRRKKNNFLADHYVDLFVRVFSQRTKVNEEDLRRLTFQELYEFMDGGNQKKYKALIDERKENAVVIYFKSNSSWKFFTSRESREVIEALSDPKIKKQGQLIQGIVASSGKSKYFRGQVKIVFSGKDIAKIKPGEILVASMTAPDYIVGMKKAGAIITDHGGITCHAAVVSRELKIPCVVGTGYATKVLNDGDIVEIHGGRGTIKIIKTRGT